MSATSGFLGCELHLLAPDRATFAFEGQTESGRPALSAPLLAELRATLDAREYGRKLFEALLPAADELLPAYRDALAFARARGERLRLRLRFDALSGTELERLIWERLFDPRQEAFLAASDGVVFSRCCSAGRPPLPRPRELPRLLVAVASPSGLDGFGLAAIPREETLGGLERGFEAAGGLRWESMDGPVTPGRLHERLVTGRFHALHLVAHGRAVAGDNGAKLFLEAEDGGVSLVDESFFAEVLRHQADLRLVCLMACHGGRPSGEEPASGLAARLAAVGVPAVVAMREAVSFEAAGRFSEVLYRHLGTSGCVDLAVNQARLQLRIDQPQSNEWSLPTLFMEVEDGRLWRPPIIRRLEGPSEEVDWDSLLARIEDQHLLPIVGPGLHGVQGEIARRWADECVDFPLDRRDDLPRVTQFVETQRFPRTPYDELPRRFAEALLSSEDEETRRKLEKEQPLDQISRLARRRLELDKDEPHSILAGLPIATYLTTNHDGFLSEALKQRGREALVERFPWQRRGGGWAQPEGDSASLKRYRDLVGSEKEPLVFHLFGSHEEPESQVLTEDDHLDLIRELSPAGARLPTGLWRGFNHSMLLFLGYDVRELDCRVLFRGLVAQLKDPSRSTRGRAAVLQVEPGDATGPRLKALQLFEEKCCKAVDITVYWGSVRDFLIELRDHWKERHGGP